VYTKSRTLIRASRGGLRGLWVLHCGVVVAAASVLIGARALQTPAAEAAAAVLADARKALGGDQKLAGVKSLVATGRTRQVRGDNLVPIEFEIAMELPDRYVRKDEVPAQESGPTTVGFNAGELIQFPAPTAPPGRGGPAPAPTPEQMDAMRRTRLAAVKQDFVRLTLGMFAGSFTSVPLTFSYVAKAEAPEGKADVLAVSGPDNFAARLFVNAETHLPIMVAWTAPAGPQRGGPPGRGREGAPAAGQAGDGRGRASEPAREGQPPAREGAPASPERGQSAPREGGPGRGPAGPPPESRLYYGDYRDVNGVKFPFRLRRATGTDTVEETIFDGFKINPKIDSKKFEVRR
jgi:hypothetical protein